MQDVHFAILGPGKIARKFADDLKLVEGAKLVTVASRSEERATAFAKTYDVDFIATSYEKVFDGPRVDVVYIATPHMNHAELSKMCIARGVAVLCEKPMGINAREVKELTAFAKTEGVYLMEALWTKFLPSFRALKQEIDLGRIGEVTGLRADFGFKVNATHGQRILDLELGGGALLDIGIYPIFLSQAILGAPTSISAVARFHESGADIDDTIAIEHAGNKLSSLHTTLLAKTKTEAVIYGSKGTIYVNGDWYKQTSFTVVLDEGQSYEVAPAPEGWGYVHEARAVVEDLRAGKLENENWTLADSVLLHETLTEIRRLIGLRYPSE